MSTKTVVLCWEYGAGLGHISQLKIIARDLQKLDCKTILVNPSNIGSYADPAFDEVLEVPYVGQLLNPGGTEGAGFTSYNSIIASLGFLDTKFVFTRLALWKRLFERTKPNLVVADFAPHALLAAKDRIPTVAIGNFYTLPATSFDNYPRFADRTETVDVKRLYRSIAQAMLMAGLEPIRKVPDIFDADIHACFTLPETDIFSPLREPAVEGPLLASPIAKRQSKGGNKYFAYLTHCKPELRAKILDSFVGLARPIDLYSLTLTDDDREKLKGSLVNVLSEPLEFTQIVNDYSMVLHLGGHLLTLEMLLTGMPQTALAIDIEKFYLGRTLSELGLLAFKFVAEEFQPQEIIDVIRKAAENEAMSIALQEFSNAWPEARQMAPRAKLLADIKSLLF